jgi:hypothetical protein
MPDYQVQSIWDHWRGIAETTAILYGNLRVTEILAIITEESNGEPNAVNKADPSFGLMGVSLDIGQEFCSSVQIAADLFDPVKNIRAGSGFLSYLKKKYEVLYPLTQSQYRGWVQMYNLGETRFRRGERVPGYEQAYLGHLAALDAIAAKAIQ